MKLLFLLFYFGLIYSQKIDSLLNIGEYTTVRKVLEKDLQEAKNSKDTLLILKTEKYQAKLNYLLGNFDQVIEHISVVLEIAKAKKLDRFISDSYTYLAIAYDNQALYNKAIEYNRLAVILHRKNNFQKALSIAYNNLGYSFKQINELDSSLIYFKKSLAIKYELNLKEKIPSTLLNLGRVLSIQNNASAIDTILKAKVLFENSDNQYYLAECLNSISKHYIRVKQFNKATHFANEAIKIAELLQAKQILRTSYTNLSISSKELKQYKRALEFKEKELILENELNASKAKLALSKYEKNTELKDLHLKEKIQASEIELLNNQARSLSIIVLLAVVIVLYSQNKRKKIRQLNDELRTANEEKNKFIGIVAHDLRSPLQIILANLELDEFLEKRAPSSETVAKEVNRMNKMINSLLNISQIEKGLLSLDLKAENFENIINERKGYYLQMCKRKDINFELDCDSNLPLVKLDKLRLIEVLDNLIGNAIKYTYKGGLVKVIIKNSIDKIEISVKDNGQGLSEEDLSKLFTGEKLNTKPTANETSDRFGLISVKKIIEAHQGKINVSSEKDHGLTFTFSLPC